MTMTIKSRETLAAEATIDWIMHAIEGDRFKDAIGQTAEDYVRYSLGTAGFLYHVNGFIEDATHEKRS